MLNSIQLPWVAYLIVWGTAMIPSVLLQLPLSRAGVIAIALERGLFSGFLALNFLLIAWIGYRFPLRRSQLLRATVIYTATAVASVEVQKLMTAVVRDLSPIGRDTDYVGPMYFPYVLIANVLIAGNALHLAARSATMRERTHRMECALAGAQLQSLEVQLDADDVFAALSRFQRAAEHDPDAALGELASLGDRLVARLEKSLAHRRRLRV